MPSCPSFPDMMRILKIDHVAIAQPDLEKVHDLFVDILGIPLTHTEQVDREGVKTHFLPAGESNLEFLEALGPETPVGRFLTKRGPGLHHLALAVEGLDEFVTRLKQAQIQLLTPEPVPGAHGKRIIFLHPRATGGILLELCESPSR